MDVGVGRDKGLLHFLFLRVFKDLAQVLHVDQTAHLVVVEDVQDLDTDSAVATAVFYISVGGFRQLKDLARRRLANP